MTVVIWLSEMALRDITHTHKWGRVLTEQILYEVDFMCLNKFWKIMLLFGVLWLTCPIDKWQSSYRICKVLYPVLKKWLKMHTQKKILEKCLLHELSSVEELKFWCVLSWKKSFVNLIPLLLQTFQMFLSIVVKTFIFNVLWFGCIKLLQKVLEK